MSLAMRGPAARLIVWRHGQSKWNADLRIQGQTDIGLTDRGRAEAARAAARLATFRPDAIVSSDLRRAADTAAALAAATGLPVHPDPRLRERHFGLWQGLSGPEVAVRYPTEYARWQAGEPIDGCGVEEIDGLAKRAASAMLEAADRAPGGTVVVVTHGAAIRYGLAELLGWPSSVPPTLGGPDNCHWATLRHEPVRGWRLRQYNAGVEAEPGQAG